MEYVSKEELRAFIDKNSKKYSITVSNVCNFKDFVKLCPSADVAPVVHGKWENVNKETEQMCKCSACGYPVNYFWGKTAYCPNCGAKMDMEG